MTRLTGRRDQGDHARAGADAGRAPSAGWALAGLSLAVLLPSLGTSSANVALPTLSAAFAAPFGHVQWVVVAYLLAATTLVVGAGRLGDLLGPRRLLLAGIGLFTAASALCGVAPTLWLLIAARAAQGIGAAVMMALSMALVGRAVPEGRTGGAMGLLGTMSAVGTALGPSLGGALIDALGWPAVFLVNLPLGVAAFLLVRRQPADVPHAGRAHRGGFDLLGTALLAATLGAYALAMTVGPGGPGPVNAALLLASALGAGLFALVERGAAFPLIRPGTLREPALGAALAMGALVSTVMMAMLVVGPFYLSRALALDAALVGAVMSVGPLSAALAGVPAGRMVDRFGARRMTVGGLVGMGAGCCLLSVLPATLGVLGFAGPAVAVAAGYALFQAANNTAVMAGVARDRRGVVSGMLTLSRNLGLVTGAAAMGGAFALASGTADPATAAPEALAGGARTAFGLAAALVALALAVALAARVRDGASRARPAGEEGPAPGKGEIPRAPARTTVGRRGRGSGKGRSIGREGEWAAAPGGRTPPCGSGSSGR
jgi:MFS family permease